MKYYKLGDYWYKGAPTFYELLTKYSIVICGNTQMCIGDIVAIAEGHTIFAVAQLSSNSYQANTRIELRDEFGEYDIPFDDNYIANARIYKLSSYITYPLQQGICEIHKADIISKLNNEISKIMSTELILKCKTILQNNHNLILTGAPGTGKTYLAKEIAKAMGAEYKLVQFHPSYDYTDFVEGLRPTGDNGQVGFERTDGVFKEFCKKALDVSKTSNSGNRKFLNFDKVYDSFIEELSENELKLKTRTHQKEFTVVLGSQGGMYAVPMTEYQTRLPINKEKIQTYLESKVVLDWKPYLIPICDYIESNYKLEIDSSDSNNNSDSKSNKFVFIIDEINRGEISKIFGELFFSIDPGYRGVDGLVQTQYQNLVKDTDIFKKGFYVPENVYIIGTMNDIDRSVESMDFAFRRRFAFKEVTSEESQKMFDNDEVWKLNDGNVVKPKDDIKGRMDKLNDAISSKKNGLNSSYHIGGAYFLKYKYYGNYKDLWDYHIDGVLREYLRGNPKIEDIMDEFKSAYGYGKEDTAN